MKWMVIGNVRNTMRRTQGHTNKNSERSVDITNYLIVCRLCKLTKNWKHCLYLQSPRKLRGNYVMNCTHLTTYLKVPNGNCIVCLPASWWFWNKKNPGKNNEHFVVACQQQLKDLNIDLFYFCTYRSSQTNLVLIVLSVLFQKNIKIAISLVVYQLNIYKSLYLIMYP